MADRVGVSGFSVINGIVLALAAGRQCLNGDSNRALLCTSVHLVLAVILLFWNDWTVRIQGSLIRKLIDACFLVAIVSSISLASSGSPVSLAWAITAFSIAVAVSLYLLYRYICQGGVLPKSERHYSLANDILNQTEVPRSANIWMLAPCTFLGIVLLGLTLTLPVGPLSDEGMIHFMEGGCDWGISNVFFFSKLGTWIAINVCGVALLKSRTIDLRFFIPHFAVYIGLSAWWNDSMACSTYYSHPQPTLLQMSMQLSSFAVLMMSYTRAAGDFTAMQKTVGLVIVNAYYPIAFYISDQVSPYWSWPHTVLVAMFHVVASAIMMRYWQSNVANVSSRPSV